MINNNNCDSLDILFCVLGFAYIACYITLFNYFKLVKCGEIFKR